MAELLLVDDDADILKLLALRLATAGHRVRTKDTKLSWCSSRMARSTRADGKVSGAASAARAAASACE